MRYVMSKTLELKNIRKAYSKGTTIVSVLEDINLTIYQGQLISIIGASGSGKSTMLHIAGLLEQADSGQIYVDSQDVANVSASKKSAIRLQHLGFIYQHHYLLKDFTALDNIIIPQLIAGQNYKNALNTAKVMLATLDLQNRELNYPGELSGGEQQRVAIARAMINTPKLLLADEPTGNLDPKNADKVFNFLLELVRKQKMSAIIVTHSHALAKNADIVYELKGGQLTPS